MDSRYTYNSSSQTSDMSERERARRRAHRIQVRKRRKRARRIRMLKRLLPLLVLALAALAALAVWAVSRMGGGGPSVPDGKGKLPPAETSAVRHILPEVEPAPQGPLVPAATDATVHLTDEITSEYAVLIDLEGQNVLAEKQSQTVIHPASMTKILTILVAAEHIPDLDATFTVTQEITDYAFVNGCTVAGLVPGETVAIRDLFYGTILPSGADAALSLAIAAAGTHEDFVTLMNEKAAELGLSDGAHFANCVGVYDENNVCTVCDIAIILKAAMDNQFCRQVLTERTYEIPANDLREAIQLDNWFIRRIEDHVEQGIVVEGAKTGFVSQSGCCAASFARNEEGRYFLCVTAQAGSSWSAIYDHAALYGLYTKPAEPAPEES